MSLLLKTKNGNCRENAHEALGEQQISTAVSSEAAANLRKRLCYVSGKIARINK
jgi:hypothetical protein